MSHTRPVLPAQQEVSMIRSLIATLLALAILLTTPPPQEQAGNHWQAPPEVIYVA